MKGKIETALQQIHFPPEWLSILLAVCIFLKFIMVHLLNGIVFTQGAFLVTFGTILAIYGIFSFFTLQARKIGLYIVDFCLSVFLLAETLYMSYFHTPLKFFTLYQVTNLNGLGGSVLYLLHPLHILFFLDLLLLFKPVFMQRHSGPGNIKLAALLLLGGCLFAAAKPVKVVWIDNMPFRTMDALDAVKAYGIVGHHVIDLYNVITDWQTKELTEQEKKQIQTWFAEKNREEKNEGQSPYFGIGKNKNLIFIQVESFQAFVLNQKVNGQEITPFLNRIVKDGMYFSNIYPQTVEGNSSDAELLTQTSLYPVKQGATFFRFPNNTYHSLAKLLREKGYHTFAIHGDEETFWNRNMVYPHLGFEKFYAIDDLKQDDIIGMGLSDKSTFRQSLPILEKADQPFYSLIITLTSHVPFTIPEDEQSLSLPKELENTPIGNYLQSIRYMDESIALFIKGLEESGLLDDSLIVIYGDHDGLFQKDKGEVEKWLKREISDEEWVRSFMQIPFIIYHPGMEPKVIDTIGGQIDILPTVADLMGIEKEKTYYMMGKNLFLQEDGKAVIPKGDYADEGILITRDKITPLPENYPDLTVADLVIRSDYFKDKKK